MDNFDLDGFRPLNGWMLVRMDEEKQLTDGGLLYKPDKSSKEHLLRKGTVLKTSRQFQMSKKKGYEFEVEVPIKEGYRVLFSAIHGDKIYFRTFKEMADDNNLVLLKPSDILLYEDPKEEGRSIDGARLGT